MSYPLLNNVSDRRLRELLRDFLDHVASAIERGEYPRKEAAAEALLMHGVPVPVAADFLRHKWLAPEERS